MKEKKKGFSLPHVYVLMFIVMFIVLLLTYIIPSGTFDVVADPASGREIIDPSTYHTVDKVNVGFLDFFVSVHEGFKGAIDVIAMLLFCAGSLHLVEQTGALGAGINAMLSKLKGKNTIILIVLTTIFSVLGTVGFAEAGTPFIPLAVSIGLALGYDRMVGTGCGVLGLCVGFTSGVVNVYTTGVAQGILGLPLYSGIAFRMVVWVILTVIAIIYVVAYSKKIKKDPTKSVMGDEYLESLKDVQEEAVAEKVSLKHKLTLLALVITIGFQVFGTLKLGWYLPELTAIYTILAIVAGIINRMDATSIANTFAKGASNILPAAIAIGLARSVLVIMEQGQVLHTLVNGLAEFLKGNSGVVVVLIIYVVVIILNFFVTSGSGKAVMLMPILGPLGQIMGIKQQVMVVAFQLGDGFTNYLWPTSGTMMASLALSKTTWEQWFKFSYKIFIVFTFLGAIFVVAAQLMELGPF